VWRSLCNSKFILKAGSRWRIGEGDDISVWYNNWIAGDVTLIPPSQGDFHLSNLRVSHCMLHNHKSWDVPFLESIFDQQTVNHITNTPLFTSVKEDRLIWSKESNGDYSVRNAYRLCLQELLDVSAYKIPGNWVNIWKLKVPPKVKNFMWRIVRNVLPTGMRLRDKRVNCPDNCVLCDSGVETNFHLFFSCPNSSNVWNLSPVSAAVMFVTSEVVDCKACIFRILQDLSSGDASLFAFILWSIWKQRNNHVWNNVTDVQAFLLERAESLLYEWTAARNVKIRTDSGGTRMQKQQQNQRFKWHKPSTDRFKCNADASFPNNDNRVGIGVCIRDEEGAFVLAKTECFEHKHEVHIGEALGFLSALQRVHELRLGPIDFELDSKEGCRQLCL